MRNILKPIIAFFLIALVAAPAWADEYTDAIAAFKNAGQSSDFFRTAYGYAVFPTIVKGALVVGGARGKGRVYARGQYVGNSTMTQASVGLQIGGAGYSEIVFFRDEPAFANFTRGNFEFSADAQAVVITAAAGAQGSTTGASAGASATTQHAANVGAYNNGMATFVLPKGGLLAGISLGGQKFTYSAR